MVRTIQEAAVYLVARLKSKGFKVQRYDAYSTNSVYLKIDYGVCNSIRISDHPGKKHLAYRYNLEKNRKVMNKTTRGKFPRYYYGFEHIGQLVQDIIRAREDKLRAYGPTKYRDFMEYNKAQGLRQKGFWQQAVEV